MYVSKALTPRRRGNYARTPPAHLYPCGQAALRALRGHIGNSKAVCGIDPQPGRYGRALGCAT